MNRFSLYSCVFLLVLACKDESKTLNETVSISQRTIEDPKTEIDSVIVTDYKELFKNNSDYISNGFDFPVGKPNAKGYYNAQKFGENTHLGDDWNGVGGGNSDLGDSIYAISNGYIEVTKDYSGGWGNVISIIHLHNDKLYKSLYAHCDTIIVKANTFIKKGDKIATIGNNNGQYYAHLHLEIRDSLSLGIGVGYSENIDGYLDPTAFIKKNRK